MIRNEFLIKYSLPPKKNILIAVPQYYEHGLCEKSVHFDFILEMVTFLSSLGGNVLLSLHPKMNILDYQSLKNCGSNVIIIDERLSEVLPACDLFVSTFSSTVSWALLCNKKIIIVDHVSLEYDDFFSEFNIPIASNNRQLIELAQDIMSFDCSFHYDTRLIDQLSPFDGLCSERISRFLCGITN